MRRIDATGAGLSRFKTQSAKTQLELAEQRVLLQKRRVDQHLTVIEHQIQQQIRQPESVLWAFGAGFVAERLGRPQPTSWSWQRLINDSLYWYQLWLGLNR